MAWKHIQHIRTRLDKEVGTVYKDWGGRLRIALAFPNTYYTGMSSLALHTVYRLFNQHPHVVCERTFWEPDLHGNKRPLLTYESQRPVADTDVFAFTISFEMDYFHVVDMLRQTRIPLWAEERGSSPEAWPLLLAGGPAISMNPEPLAPFFDAMVIGEGEEIIPHLIALLEEHRDHRDRLLDALARLPGVYVPLLHGEGTRVSRLWVRDVGHMNPQTVIYTPDTEFGAMHLMEIGRGCGRGCRYCMAGYVYRPPREQPLERVLAWAKEALQHTRRIGLVSAAVSDYSRIDELAIRLREMGARISVSSMRTDPISEPLVRALAESGTRTLTIAPEAGSERLRRVISKTQQEEDLLAAVDLAERYRFPQLKLYFMVGHPTETDEDIDALIRFVLEVRQRFRRTLIINATPFVPKPHTPFQWVAMTDASEIQRRQRKIQKALSRHRVIVRADSPQWAQVQGVLARGDRALARVLARLQRRTWRQFFRTMEEEGLDPQVYLGEWPQDITLPWNVVDSGIKARYLIREWRLSLRGQPGKECPPQARGCLRCGVCDWAWAFREEKEHPCSNDTRSTA